MSGGYFRYDQYRIEGIADSIDKLIDNNDSTGGQHYSRDIIEKFKIASQTLRQAAEMAHRVDWLVSGDDGEDSFRERWEDEVRK